MLANKKVSREVRQSAIALAAASALVVAPAISISYARAAEENVPEETASV